jgi:hypothetical protein
LLEEPSRKNKHCGEPLVRLLKKIYLKFPHTKKKPSLLNTQIARPCLPRYQVVVKPFCSLRDRTHAPKKSKFFYKTNKKTSFYFQQKKKLNK